jgi:RHS repeat-associated protein
VKQRSLCVPVLLSLLSTPALAQSGPGGTVRYYDTDAVGSVRLVTDASGHALAQHDYLPFGLELASVPDPAPQRFTGKERDSETALDYFGARYYAGARGRFTTVDPGHAGADASSPQSWNAYTYGLNNPLRFDDPTGTCSQDAKGNYSDRDDAGTLIATGACTKTDSGALTVGVASSVTVKPKSDIVALAEGVSIGAGPVADPRFIAGFYGASALGGAALWAGGAFSGGEIVSLGLDDSLLSNAEAGQIIGWGKGQEGVELTRSLADNLTKESVEQWKLRGLNKATVENLLRVYERAFAQEAKRLANQQLLPRLVLMKKILDLW